MAAAELQQRRTGRVLDIGCGAGRNAVPLARLGWTLLGTDLSWPMLRAAADRISTEAPACRARFVLAPMDHLPVASATVDIVVAQGIWNLAGSDAMFRSAVAEAARVARPGAALFVFTFSRHTLSTDAEPVAGQRFVFTQFSGQPQCFLTEGDLLAELRIAGFALEPGSTVREYNRPRAGSLMRGSGPVIYEAVFRREPD
jgi:ubiquinone/menaquinone biosynthesis C-methylase UbiE